MRSPFSATHHSTCCAETSTRRPVTIAVTGVDKVYDATTLGHPVATVTSGLVGAETLASTALLQFPIKDVGTYPVSVDIALVNGTNGGLASNYSVAPTVNVSASITPASLTVTGVTANNKVYDATRCAPPSAARRRRHRAGQRRGDASAGTPLAHLRDEERRHRHGGPGQRATRLSGADAGNYTLVATHGA